MRDAKADSSSALPEWVAENKEIRTLFRKTENANQRSHQNSSEFLNSQRKFTHLMKVDPKQAERLDFRYVIAFSYSIFWDNNTASLK